MKIKNYEILFEDDFVKKKYGILKSFLFKYQPQSYSEILSKKYCRVIAFCRNGYSNTKSS